MKTMIINKTNLTYNLLGQIIDESLEYEETIYYGKISYFKFCIKDKIYQCQIRYLKKYTEWCFYEKN